MNHVGDSTINVFANEDIAWVFEGSPENCRRGRLYQSSAIAQCLVPGHIAMVLACAASNNDANRTENEDL
jgi:hypothetical protein